MEIHCLVNIINALHAIGKKIVFMQCLPLCSIYSNSSHVGWQPKIINYNKAIPGKRRNFGEKN
jgi:hypothetical protein